MGVLSGCRQGTVGVQWGRRREEEEDNEEGYPWGRRR